MPTPCVSFRECMGMMLLLIVRFFFFFQAEDGIRDLTVTGVQTCALPISRNRLCLRRSVPGRARQRTPDPGRAATRPEGGARDHEPEAGPTRALRHVPWPGLVRPGRRASAVGDQGEGRGAPD